MKRKALKENIMIIFTIIIVVLAVIGIRNNEEKEVEHENNQENTDTSSFVNPDRIIYKVGKEDRYYIFTKENKEEYNDILTELVKGITGLSEGETLTDEEVLEYEENENCIILDYFTASKNYLIRLNSNDSSVLKQKEDGWQVVKRLIVNKLDIQKAINKSIKNAKSYKMKESKNYLSENTIEEIPEDYKNLLIKKDDISYYMVINNIETLNKLNKDFNVSIGITFNEDIFNNNNIVILVTKGKITEIKTCVGHIKYFINYDEYKGYFVNEYLVSKVVNINCIYTKTKESDIIKNKDGYIVKNGIETLAIISNKLLNDTQIKELELINKGNRTYYKIVTKEELIHITDKLELKCISEMNFYNNISGKFDSNGKYIILLKNTKGRFSIKEFEYSEKYRGIPIDKDFNINIFDIQNNVGKLSLKGIIVKLPDNIEINDIKLNRIQINRSKIISNKIDITEEKAIEIAKKVINDTDETSKYEIYTDLVPVTNNFYQYKMDLEKVEYLVESYIVCKLPKEENQSEIQQIIINSHTGEIISSDEIPC